MVAMIIPIRRALTMMDGWMDEMNKQRAGSQQKYIKKKNC
jgi:hypothetical protein